MVFTEVFSFPTEGTEVGVVDRSTNRGSSTGRLQTTQVDFFTCPQVAGTYVRLKG